MLSAVNFTKEYRTRYAFPVLVGSVQTAEWELSMPAVMNIQVCGPWHDKEDRACEGLLAPGLQLQE